MYKFVCRNNYYFFHKSVGSIAVYYVEIILKTNNSEYKYLQTFTNIYYFNSCFNKCLSKNIVIKLLNILITRNIVFIPNKSSDKLAVYNTDIVYTVEYNL